METNYLFFIGLMILISILYMSFKEKIFTDSGDYLKELYANEPIGMTGYSSQSARGEKPGNAPIEVMRTSYSPPKTVASAGPNSPSQEAPKNQVVVLPPATANDPYADTHESAIAEPDLRYPERSFRPAPLNDYTGIAVEAGIAGERSERSATNFQKFGPELVQNGGMIIDGVFANDTLNDHSYSAF